jgi:hypothetical protein
VLLYFARGSLPWQGLKAATKKENSELIRQEKLKLPVTKVCERLPEEFATYISYTRSLGFKDRPDYDQLRRLFRDAFLTRGFEYDNVFDWTVRRFFEMQGDVELQGDVETVVPTTQ